MCCEAHLIKQATFEQQLTKASHTTVVPVGCDMLLDFNIHVNTLTFTYNPNAIQ